MDITIIICTHNRSELLRDSLASFFTIARGDAGSEVLVVDNNSTDPTPDVVNNFVDSHGSKVRYAAEAKVGLSHARNQGILQSNGDIIAFIDDDVYFDQNWLKEIVRVFRTHAEVDCVGGKSEPIFEIQRPEWVTDDFLSIYGSTDSGDDEKIMEYPEHPFGLNMAFRRDVFDKVGYFNPNLGRKGKSLLSSEENDMFYRIHQAGLITHYTPKAIIYHRIPPERTSKDWILKRYYWQGISNVAFQQIVKRKSRPQLAREIIRHAMNLTFGPNWRSPREVLRYYGDYGFKDRVKASFLLGTTRQKLYEMFNADS